ncbi:Rne/Rng family ribonuclease [Pseudogemmobacter sonorensis]|uniref:Rne/Rng family ribonuclease n=1 Tax=Pseudogemmobacter sonorensis TaxID=2989681 RepID=UPI0036915273
MAKKMLIDATHAEETRVVVVDGNKVEEFDFETLNKRQLAGNIYLAKVTRVEPSLQAAFVDYGGNRHGFLAFAEIHPDYYQIPVADRKALIEEERALARAEEEEENRRHRRKKPSGRTPARAEAARGDAVVSAPAAEGELPEGMAVIDLDDGGQDGGIEAYEAEGAAETPSVAQPDDEATAVEGASEDAREDDGAETSGDEISGDEAHADADDGIESIAEEDMAEEISAPKRVRARKYKIQEVIKVRQIMLVQVVKEERGNKGAALTTYLSLAGRYCVLMPNTARGGGISRKITQAADRKKLKEIAGELEVPEGAGLIIRTAGAKRTKPEIKRDYEYLMRLWEQVRDLTLKSIAPAAIYEEGDLIKRSIRDLYSREIDEVLVEGEAGYRTARDFMRMIMPSHARQVKLYADAMPLFARHQVESYLGGMFNPVVQLKSGGYIVIGVTEALVAIDVNSGRATKEGSIEDTALKTNLEAADEVARQLRLRDLAGLIVIDFIDMEERKNNIAVEKRLKDKLKTDRARIQIGRISGFGLMEMSRQRLRPGMLESTTQPCAHCHGTGLIRSDDSMALTILRALEEEGTRNRSKEVLLKAPVGIVNYLFNHKREHIALIEARYGMAVRMEADPALISPDYLLEKFKTATRSVPEPVQVISGHAGLMGAAVEEEDLVDEVFEEEEEEVAESAAAKSGRAEEENGAEAEGGDGRKKRRRRRRRRGNGRDGQVEGAEDGAEDAAEAVTEDAALEAAAEVPAGADAPETAPEAVEAAPVAQAPAEPVVEAPAKPKRTRKPRVSKASEAVAAAPVVEPAVQPVAKPAPAEAEAEAAMPPGTAEAAEPAAKPRRSRASSAKAPAKSAAKPRGKKAAEAVADPAETVATAAPASETRVAEAPVAEAPVLPALQPDPGPAAVDSVQPDPAAEAAVEPQGDLAIAPAPGPAAADEAAPGKPRRSGWWSLGR